MQASIGSILFYLKGRPFIFLIIAEKRDVCLIFISREILYKDVSLAGKPEDKNKTKQKIPNKKKPFLQFWPTMSSKIEPNQKKKKKVSR